jgi:hypothetical protein
MTEFPPNPLVTALAQKLVDGNEAFAEADRDARYLARLVKSAAASPDQRAEADQLCAAVNEMAMGLANQLAADPTVPPLVTFAGFLGGTITADGSSRTWRVFYLDAKLLTWLLFEDDKIVHSQRLEDETAPFGERDILWLRSSTSVTEGSGVPRANEIEAQFTRGDFIGAGDFSASLTGGTFSRATGLLCEVQTPGCCGRRTQ